MEEGTSDKARSAGLVRRSSHSDRLQGCAYRTGSSGRGARRSGREALKERNRELEAETHSCSPGLSWSACTHHIDIKHIRK